MLTLRQPPEALCNQNFSLILQLLFLSSIPKCNFQLIIEIFAKFMYFLNMLYIMDPAISLMSLLHKTRKEILSLVMFEGFSVLKRNFFMRLSGQASLRRAETK